MTTPSLLLPAGNLQTFQTALRFGADAVYCGMDQFSLRAQADNFDRTSLESAIRMAHSLGKTVHITLNIFARGYDREKMLRAAAEARDIGADALIVSDLGMIAAICREVPGIDVHVSTQANTTNASSARVYRDLGAVRVVAARELTLTEIEEMAEELGNTMEVETFIHGAECMSFSGRCMLSAAMIGRSANRGDCAQPCRWSYALVERSKPDLYWEIEETQRGDTILSAHDLCMIEHIPRLMRSKIACFKVEGRMKNELYVATIGLAYRRMMDACRDGKMPGAELMQECIAEVHKVSHRPYDTGFYFGSPPEPGLAKGTHQQAEFIGRILEVSGGTVLVEMRNRFFRGEMLELLTPAGIVPFPVESIRRENGEMLDQVNVPMTRVQIPFAGHTAPGDLLRGPVRNRANT